ncbi:MAG: extracellular solute-binding protein, partial [Pseudomonadota bacterium]
IANDGADSAQSWAQGVVANFARPPQGNDTANTEAVASGECRFSIVNTYYLPKVEKEAPGTLDNIGIIFPNQDTTGTHINISGAGVLVNAPNRGNAIRFLEYLTEPQAQSYFANGNNEYPAVTGVEAASAVEALGTFRPDTLNAGRIGEGQAEAVRIFDRAGWN